jgi:hypothetical protein
MGKIVPRRRLTVLEKSEDKRQKLAGIDFPYDLLRQAPRATPAEKSLHFIYYYPWEMTPRIGGRQALFLKVNC